MKWVKWTKWRVDGMAEHGQMPKADVDMNLRRFEAAASKFLKETDADHVLYGLKYFNESGELEEVNFYLIPMTEEEFEEKVARLTGVQVYALHAKR